MNLLLCLLAAGLYLCLQCQVTAGSHLSRTDIERAVGAAKALVDSAYDNSRRASIERLKRNAASPSDLLQFLKQPVGLTRSAVRVADYMDNAIKLLRKSLGRRQKRSINATDLITDEDLQAIARLTGCSPQHRAPSCNTIPHLDTFRTASSTCNNREHTRWGSSNTPFTRWLPAEYQDDSSVPKGWDPDRKLNGHKLPLVREVSNQIVRSMNSLEEDPLYTHLVAIFGQWTDHDLTFTPHSAISSSISNGIDCDQSCERAEPCFPIQFPKDDPRLSRHSKECMPFFRSSAACGSGPSGHIFGGKTVRQQINGLTSFIDVGQVYGADDVKARFLRDLTTDKGLLRVNTEHNDNSHDFLPFAKTDINPCATRARITNEVDAEEVPCFVAGDERANEHIALTALHTLFLREHNRLAGHLAELNPHWNGERLYQEARKILGAYSQVITFRDYLPHIVGPEFVASRLSNYPGYDDNVDPSISNVFATAAYRFGHLIVNPHVPRLDASYNEHRDYPSPLLHKAFFAPWRLIFEGGLDPVIRGLVGHKAKLNTQDQMMTEELRDRLFKFFNELALDLAALNMQRGRDHGLPGYNKWRNFCGLSQPRNLVELAKVLNNTDLARKILNLYGTPDNIDVWLGGAAEPFVRGGRVGPLFACLISTQFQRIRQGDRLWWENEGVFTEAQRESLRETSLARIICDNTGIDEVPENPFQYRPRGSGYTQCSNIEAFNLSPWRENRAGNSHGQQGPPGPRGPRGLRGPPGPAGAPSDNVNVAFTVRLGNDFPDIKGPIIFREVIYNEQKSYDVRTGFFTCEYPGVYEFQFHCIIFQKAVNVDLMRNGERILHSFTTRQSSYTTASGSTYIRLNVGDKIVLNTDQGASGFTSDSFLSGHLLFQ